MIQKTSTDSIAPTEWKYHAFISYAREDEIWATWCHKMLETFVVPKSLRKQYPDLPKRIYPVFKDRDELRATPNVDSAIFEALERSDCLIVICSPDAVKSDYVNKEVAHFKHLGRPDRIFTLIVSGEPSAGSNHPHQGFPISLRYNKNQDGEWIVPSPLPLAADVREKSGSKEDARYKLLAGILEVGYDDLRQRDRRRQVFKRRLQVSVISTVLICTSFLVWLIVKNYNEAKSQEVAKITAIEEFADLAGRSYDYSNVAERTVLLEKAKARLMEVLTAQKMSDTKSGTLLKACRLIVGLAKNKGLEHDSFELRDLWLTAHKYSGELLRRDADDQKACELRFETACTLAGLAITHGVLEDRPALLEEAERMLQKIGVARPKNEEWAAHLVKLRNLQADYRIFIGDVHSAMQLLNEAVDAIEAHGTNELTDEFYFSDVVRIYRDKGRLLVGMNEVDGAHHAFNKAETLLTNQMSRVTDPYWLEGDMADILRSRATLYFGNTRTVLKAVEPLDKAIAILRGLSNRTDILPLLASSYRQELGKALRERSQVAFTQKDSSWKVYLDESHEIFLDRAKEFPSQALAAMDLADSFWMIASGHLSENSILESNDAINQAIKISVKASLDKRASKAANLQTLKYLTMAVNISVRLRDFPAAHQHLNHKAKIVEMGDVYFPPPLGNKYELASIEMQTAEVFYQINKRDEASAHIQRSVEILREAYSVNPENLFINYQLAIALRKKVTLQIEANQLEHAVATIDAGFSVINAVQEPVKHTRDWMLLHVWFQFYQFKILDASGPDGRQRAEKAKGDILSSILAIEQAGFGDGVQMLRMQMK